jgi:hypothetical protein
MIYSTFEPLYNNNNLEEQSNINNFGHFFPLYSDNTGQINTNKEQNIQNYYERKKDKQIIKTRTSYMEFKKPSYNEIQYIIKWNPKYFK